MTIQIYHSDMPKKYQRKREDKNRLKAVFSKIFEKKEPDKPVKIIDSKGKTIKII